MARELRGRAEVKHALANWARFHKLYQHPADPPDGMRGISIRQPMAEAIAAGIKDIENRPRRLGRIGTMISHRIRHARAESSVSARPGAPSACCVSPQTEAD
eukprot:475144_1